jgi:DNA adenine methylase
MFSSNRYQAFRKLKRMKPILRWAGSKKYLAEYLIPRFPGSYSRYVEPFCGSASLFFINEPKKALLADVNGELINALREVKKCPIQVGVVCQGLPMDSDSYYLIRSWQPSQLDDVERAARFIYLNKLCFNGLYRTNKSGDFNVPFSGIRTPKMASLEDLQQASLVLKGAELSNWDYKKTLEKTKSGDFVYIDPPYVSVGSVRFSEYDPKSFCPSEIEDLYAMLVGLEEKGVKFMLSYAKCEDMRPFRMRWNCDEVRVRRNIAGFADHRRQADEVVITNY